MVLVRFGARRGRSRSPGPCERRLVRILDEVVPRSPVGVEARARAGAGFGRSASKVFPAISCATGHGHAPDEYSPCAVIIAASRGGLSVPCLELGSWGLS